MRIEDQVISLELSKKLKSLGFEQESLWYWDKKADQRDVSKHYYELDDGKRAYRDSRNPFFKEDAYSAYTVAELLKIVYDMADNMFPVIHDRDLKPEEMANYLAEVACNIKEEETELHRV